MSERAKALLARVGHRSLSFEPFIPGGKAPEITGNDIAAALAGTDVLGAMFCFAKYSGDKNALVSSVQLLAKRMAGRPKYDFNKDLDKPRFVQTAISQEHAENIANILVNIECHSFIERCPKCQGRKYVTVKNLKQPCKRCDGTGRAELKANRIANLAAIDRNLFRRRGYMKLFEEWRGKLQELETAALYHLEKHLGKEVA